MSKRKRGKNQSDMRKWDVNDYCQHEGAVRKQRFIYEMHVYECEGCGNWRVELMAEPAPSKEEMRGVLVRSIENFQRLLDDGPGSFKTSYVKRVEDDE